jgi:hypothetical protein
MRRPTMIAVMVMALCGSVAASTTFDLGLKVGGGMSKLNIAGADMKAGLDGGAFFGIRLNPNLSIQTEILYAQKGMEFNLLGLGDFKWEMDYIEIPIVVKRGFSTSGNLKPVFFAGPAISFLSSAKRTSSVMGTEEEEDIKEGFKSTDIGVTAGAGLDWLMGTNGRLVADLRLTISLIENRDTSSDILQDTIGDEGSLRNLNITLMVGYGFELGGAGR